MTANVYEGLFIFDSDAYARGADEVSSQVTSIVEQVNGEVLLSRLWDERKLEYPINGHRRGTYWLAYFKTDPSTLSDLNRQFKLSGSILRFLLVKVDPRLVDTLVEHARAGHLYAGEHADVSDDAAPVSIVDAASLDEEETE